MASGAKTGGFTCSISDCLNNDKRRQGVSFPKDKKLKNICFKKFSRIDLKPTNGHRVCGQHFEGGKKTYRDQLSPEEEDETRDVASVRIHVESAIKRVKNYNILTQIMPNSMAEDLNKIWKVCALLSNLKGCLVT